MISIGKLRDDLNRLKTKRDMLEEDLEEKEEALEDLEVDLDISRKALAIIQKVGMETQQALEYRISEIVNLALSAVFEDPYMLRVKFEVKRGQTECFLSFERDGSEFNPLDAAGGGVIDIASFALRLTCLTLIKPRPRNLLILDEPFRFLSVELQPKASAMLKELSEKLGIQIIMVTHSPTLIQDADTIFRVNKVKEVSHVAEG